jgi:hypothetical protein
MSSELGFSSPKVSGVNSNMGLVSGAVSGAGLDGFGVWCGFGV